MKTIPHIIFLAISCLLINGCEKNAKNVDTNRARVSVDSAMEKRVADDEKNHATTVDNVNALYSRVGQLEKGNAYLSTEREEFGWAVTDFGRFPVRCAGVSPILDGYKIHLLIGNMTTAILGGATVTAYSAPPRPEQETGEADSQYQKRLNDWYRLPLTHLVEVKVTSSLRPGTWTGVDVVFAPASPNDVKRITVGLEFTSISLSSH